MRVRALFVGVLVALVLIGGGLSAPRAPLRHAALIGSASNS